MVNKHQAEGYTLTTLNARFASVYPSNNATRTQLDGRIDRLGQQAPRLTHYTVHAGILTNILQRHQEARTLAELLSALAVEVEPATARPGGGRSDTSAPSGAAADDDDDEVMDVGMALTLTWQQ